MRSLAPAGRWLSISRLFCPSLPPANNPSGNASVEPSGRINPIIREPAWWNQIRRHFRRQRRAVEDGGARPAAARLPPISTRNLKSISLLACWHRPPVAREGLWVPSKGGPSYFPVQKRGELSGGLGQSANFATGYLHNLLILCTREIGDSPRRGPQAYFAPKVVKLESCSRGSLLLWGTITAS